MDSKSLHTKPVRKMCNLHILSSLSIHEIKFKCFLFPSTFSLPLLFWKDQVWKNRTQLSQLLQYNNTVPSQHPEIALPYALTLSPIVSMIGFLGPFKPAQAKSSQSGYSNNYI